ncbi:MAG: hypothetical protein ACFFC7_23435 [Candidatus Hermodarchaeota archaeon]
MPTPSEARLIQFLQRSTTRAKKELIQILSQHRAWRWKGGEPALSLPLKGQQALQKLINRWKRKGQFQKVFKKAATLLERQFDHLLVFFHHPAIPVSNQALETDHGCLKQLWRRISGCQDRAYLLAYHGHSASMTRNCYQGDDTPSPLEILGFPPEIIENWYRTCSSASLQDARQQMVEVRLPRRRALQIKRHSLREVFKDSLNDWLQWSLEQLSQYLQDQGG